MSKIGKQPINIPSNVNIEFSENIIKVKGPQGELSLKIPPVIGIQKKDNQLIISLKSGDNIKDNVAIWGTTRSLINNMIKGAVNKFEKKLELEGVGYKAQLQGRDLVLNLGYTHPINFKCPEGIEFKVEKNIITVSGINKELVGRVAAEIRALRKPEPYKGKGIRYVGEIIRRKSGKKAITTA